MPGTPTPPPTETPRPDPTPTPPPDGGSGGVPAPGAAGGGSAGGRTATPDGRRTGTRPRTSFDSWEFWWGYNRDSILDLRARLRRSTAREATDAELAGVGRRHRRSTGRQDASGQSVRNRIIPALEAAMSPDRRVEIRAAAALALAKCGATWQESTAATSSLLGYLARNESGRVDAYLEESAALALGILGSKDAAVLELLTGKLRGRIGSSRHPQTRAFSAVALGLLDVDPADPGYESVVEALREAVANDTEASRDVAVCALTGMGLSGDPTLVPELLAMATDGRDAANRRLDDLVRAHAVSAVGKIASSRPEVVNEDVVDAVVRLLGGRGLHTPRSAAIAAGSVGDAVADDLKRVLKLTRALLHAVANGEAQVSRFALISLGRTAAAVSDEALRAQIVAHLVERTNEGPDASRPFAALALGLALGPAGGGGLHETAEKAVRTAFTSYRGDPRHRGGFAIALGMLRARTAVPTLIATLRDKRATWRLRGACAVALGLIGDTVAREPLRETIVDPGEPRLRGDLAVAAGLLGDHRALADLIEMVTDPETPQVVQTSVTVAVGLVGDRRAVDPLVALLGNEKTPCRVRALAAVGLGLLADRSDRAAMTRVSNDVNYRAQVRSLSELLRIL